MPIVARVVVALGAALGAARAAARRFAGWRRRRRWNRQYANGDWDHLDACRGNEVLEPLVSRYARGGDILDVGCGRASNLRLDEGTYASYLGIDLSDVAIEQARSASRIARARFVAADMRLFALEPGLAFSLILFRESIYYVSSGELPSLLESYGRRLTPEGVIVVCVWKESLRRRFDAAVSGRSGFAFVEQHGTPEGGWIGVLRPRDALRRVARKTPPP